PHPRGEAGRRRRGCECLGEADRPVGVRSLRPEAGRNPNRGGRSQVKVPTALSTHWAFEAGGIKGFRKSRNCGSLVGPRNTAKGAVPQLIPANRTFCPWSSAS